MNFKVAELSTRCKGFKKSLFTRVALKGGPIEPREVVDAYLNANRAMFNVKKNFKSRYRSCNSFKYIWEPGVDEIP